MIACLTSSAAIFCAVIVAVVVRTRLYRGPRYALRHNGMATRLRYDLLDAGVCARRDWPFFGQFDQLPKFRISFADDFRTAKLEVGNSIKADKRLDDVDFSAALRGYIVERHFSSIDRNFYVYELLDAQADYKQSLDLPAELLSWSHDHAGRYEIAIDERTVIPITHCLLTGGTGSGKTVGLNMLMTSALDRGVRLAYCDPKRAGIYSFGMAHDRGRTGCTFNEIAEFLSSFVQDMNKRKQEMAKLMKGGLGDDYRAFGLKPYVIAIDEYSAWAFEKATKPKAERDAFDADLAAVLLQGRQLRFFVWPAIQQANAQLISTSMRGQFQFRCVLGSAREQTYVTCLDAGAMCLNVTTAPVKVCMKRLFVLFRERCGFPVLNGSKWGTPVM